MFYIVLEKIKTTNFYIYLFHFWTILFLVIPFVLVVWNAFFSSGYEFKENIAFVNSDLFFGLYRSFLVAVFTIFIVLLLSYPFAYWVTKLKSIFSKLFVIFFVSSPLWSSVFVKLIGFKSFLDLINGEFNSTKGLFYVILGLVYINLPISIISFYDAFSIIPKNIMNASLDLGRTHFETFFKIFIPYTKESIISVILMVFLPSFTAISVADFMNSDSSSKLAGQIISSYSGYGVSDNLTMSRMSFLIICFVFFIFIFYLLIKLLPKLFKFLSRLYADKRLA